MLDTLLVSARFVHFAAALVVFGAAIFPYYARVPANFPARSATLGALASGLFWFGCVLISVTGDTAALLDADQISLVLFNTSFGQTWLIHLVFSVALAALSFTRLSAVTTLAAAVNLISLSGIGHTATSQGIELLLHLASQTVHLVAAGVWMGALVPLWSVLPTAPSEERITIVNRFKWAGYGAVSLVLLTGLINTWLVTHSVLPSTTSTYGKLLLVKLFFVAALLLVALFNQFVATRRRDWRLLTRGIAAEACLFSAIVLAVSWLGMTSPMEM